MFHRRRRLKRVSSVGFSFISCPSVVGCVGEGDAG
jgi:hypothetical protein